MRVLFRRMEPSGKDKAGAAAVSVLVGLGSAAVAFYLTRLLLARERLGSDD